MSYYWFKREELLEKEKIKYHNKGSKEKAAKYYEDNKKVIKEKARNRKEEKESKRQYSRNRYNKLKQQYKG